MTLPEAEQAVIRAAIEWRELGSSNRVAALLRSVDTLLALRLAGAGGERWRPKPGDPVRFKGSTVARKVVEYLPLSTGEMLVTESIGRGSVYATVEQLEPVPEQAKQEESENG